MQSRGMRGATSDRVNRLFCLLLVVTGCSRSAGDIDEFIGAACTRDSQCDERCYQDGGDFPGGFCSVSCNSDLDCPSDTACIDKAGGVCMFLCSEVDCARLGPGWFCNDKDARGSSGKVNVCIGD